MSEAVEEALILDIDIIELEHKKEMKKKQEEVDALKLLLQGKSPEETAEILHYIYGADGRNHEIDNEIKQKIL